MVLYAKIIDLEDSARDFRGSGGQIQVWIQVRIGGSGLCVHVCVCVYFPIFRRKSYLF